jgi:VWFA-related protein
MKPIALRAGALAMLLLMVPARLLFAQQSAQSSPAVQQPEKDLLFKSVVNRVILDVVVTDSLGKPVHGLTQQDFSLAEDGQSQQILSFDVHDLEAATEFPKLLPLPANTFVNVPTASERGPLYVLLLDLVNTEIGDEAYARQQLLKFINGRPQGTRFAIFALSDGLHLVQGFTNDQKELSAVLDPSHPRPHLPRIFLNQRNYGKGDIAMMVSVFTFISRYLDGIPGRKNLIWFSGGFPLELFPTDNDSSEAYRDQVKITLDTMARSQVALYPVDIRGVAVDNPHAPAGNTGGGGVTSDYRSGGSAEPASDTSPSGSGAQATGASFSNAAQAAGAQGYSLLSASYLLQDEIAKVTGGRAYHSNNGIKEILDEALDDGANYYSLTYSPSNKNYNGALRHIQVNLSKKGYRLSYRRSYYALNPDAPVLDKTDFKRISEVSQSAPTRQLGDSLYANMQHGAPLAHQLFFRVRIHALGEPAMATPAQMANLEDQPAYFRARRKNRPLKPPAPIKLQSYVIDYTFMAGSRPGTAGHTLRPPKLEVAAAAYDDDGRMLNALVETSGQSGNEASAPQNPQGIYRVQQQLDVPLAATSLRVALRDISTDHIGAMEIRLPLAPEMQTQAAPPAKPAAPSLAPTRPN